MYIHSLLHDDTQTYTHILIDKASKQCAVIDPVLDYDHKSGQTHTDFADQTIAYIEQHGLSVLYIIETHAHADHLSAAQHIKHTLGGQLVIGSHINEVQHIFKTIFNLDMSFKTDASQFDILTKEGDTLTLGEITIEALHVPGHTPADMAYIARKGDRTVVFVGDTLFAPDVGTARCDFPGGDAGLLYDSIQKVLSLPDDTQIYLCHDYPPTDRPHSPVSTVAEQKAENKHVHDGVTREAFIAMRTERDATLAVPRLILPAVQVNIRAGQLPEPEANGVRYLKVPINTLN